MLEKFYFLFVVSLSPGSFPHMVEAVQAMHIAAPIIFVGKMLLASPAAYHISNGLRHLVSGKLINKSKKYSNLFPMLLYDKT